MIGIASLPRPRRALLREAGHDVYTPTLTGLGERAHLLRPEIGLETHIQDLVAVFEFEDIRDAVLLATATGNLSQPGAMEQIADRVRSVVFIEALVPRSGESVSDIFDREWMKPSLELAEREGEGWYLPPPTMRARSEAEPRFTYRVVECAHDIPVTEPGPLADLLLEEVKAGSPRPVNEVR